MPSFAATNTTYTFNAVPLFSEVTNSANSNNSIDTTGKYKTYLPGQLGHDRNALYMKFGDTISIPIYNPTSAANGGNTYQFLRGGLSLTNQQQYPYPDNYPANSTAPTRSGTFTNTLTWPSYLTDTNPQTSGGNPSFNYDTAWPFYGGPYGTYPGTNGSGVGYKHSMRVRTSIVQGALYGQASGTVSTSNSGQAISATVGTSIPIYGSGISGLNEIGTGATSMTDWANKLYLSVWDQSGNTKYTSGFTWQYGSSWLGFITGNVSSTTLNTGSLPAGTYTVILNHWSGGTTTSSRDRRTAADSRMWYLDLTLTAAADLIPTASSYDFTDLTGVSTNILQESNLRTPTGYNTASPIVVPSGDGRAFRVFAPGAGAWYPGGTAGRTISPGNVLQLRAQTPTNTSTTRSTTVSIGGQLSTTPWTVTTAAAATNSNPSAFSFPNVAGAVKGDPAYSDSVQLLGYTAAATVINLASGTAYQLNGAGSYITSTGGTIPLSASIRLRITASSSYLGTATGRITIGSAAASTQSGLWTVTSEADNSGFPGALAGGSTYGLMIKNDNGNVIFSPDFRQFSVVKQATITGLAAGSHVTVTGIEYMTANNSGNHLVYVRSVSAPTLSDEGTSVTVELLAGGFKLTNNSSGARTITYLVTRH